jgi:hypothetical protein
LARYEELEKPGVGYPMTYFSSVKTGLFGDIIRKYNTTMGINPGIVNKDSVSMHRKTAAAEGR